MVERDTPTCELCREVGGQLVLRTDALRVVLVDMADYPGFVRVIWNSHVREMTDLAAADRSRLLAAVFAVEQAHRQVLAPEKINLASLGNVVPHLHWHVIPRFTDDAHFPQPIWAARQRDVEPAVLAARGALLPQLAAAIRDRLAAPDH